MTMKGRSAYQNLCGIQSESTTVLHLLLQNMTSSCTSLCIAIVPECLTIKMITASLCSASL
ncbi:uncharacterized protein BDW43DRAFT_276937 [Aspergillus alliaceus]|uniref:uncharacterized protein n=1 Tax=Petromyces alliaceus TaxID=209559 RepID=UPI0012A40399|nr:uncharacterized protein BDW43DRAFT_276937 [Aspergillus alliaceus]KAB8233307.1 hypothetical protein BDW43DRAFT_276937 [Aspergillus alliaceus]